PADRSSVRTPENCLAACEWRPYAGRQSPADRFSPGVAGSMQGDGTPPPSGILADIRITEILSAPAPVVGDANGDGRIDSYEDEFVELHNAGADAVDLAGWQLSDDDTTPERRFTFPEGTILPPEAYVVLFGGGTPEHDDFVFIDDGRIGNGLTNDGDTVLLIDAMGRIVSTVPFGSVGDTGQSWEISAGLEPHAHGQLPGRSLFSPGSARPVYAAFSVDTLRLTLGRPPPLPVLRGQAPDGGALIDPNSVRWLTLHDDVLRFDGSHPVPLRVGDTVLEAWLQGAVVARAPALVRQPSPANSAPRFISTPPAGAWVAGRFRYEPVVVDDEGTTLAFAPVQLPDWLQIGCDNGILWGRAPPFPGHFEAAIQVTDGQGGLATQAFPLEVRRRPPLRISEVLADPPPGIAGDANGDGVRQTWGDEFVELVNDDTGAIDLDGWQLVDASGQHPFTFPSHTLLNVGSRIVVYGSDAGGRLGNGLDNQRETISVIDPAGPETLAVVRFELAAGPRESLVWDKGEILPQLHSRWPGRLSYSPGRSRPIAVALRLVPARMQLLAGSTASLQPVVRYSDGVSVPLVPQPVVPWSWHQPSVITSLVADTVAGTIVGAITGTAPGRDSVTFTIGNLQASTDVTVRQPLAQSLSFVPGWSQARVTAGTDLSFGVRHRDDRLVQCEWQVSGGGRSHGCQIRWRRSDASGDTVRVLVRSPGGAFGVDELVTHTWLLATNHAPSLSPPSVTELAPLQVFTQALTVSDADSDAVALTLDLAPPGLRLDGRQGILQWTPTGQQLGAHPVRVRASDGRTSTVIDFVLTVGAAPRPALASGCSAALAASPNPFRTDLTLRLCQATGVTARVDVVDMLGRRIRRLPWPAGSTRLSWDALDQAGRPVATGVYFFEWRSATTRHHARAIRLE
ncbi:MAG: lamin tail domain-containing protein, partial [bacterium]|nr:lamin tail domain-containing protein [bacterium]